MKITIVKPSAEIITPVSWDAEIMRLLEDAGRTCYKSEDKATDDSAGKFIRGIINRGHESVIEHAVYTARIIGDRSMSHQLVRHRIAAYSQESQRYCDYGKKGLQVVCPPSIGYLAPGTWEHRAGLGCMSVWDHEGCGTDLDSNRLCKWLDNRRREYKEYLDLREDGIPPEDARSVLPNATKTEVVSTFNLRQWRHVFRERALNKRAQWQIRQIMCSLLRQMASRLPVIFGDQLEVLKLEKTT